MSDFVTIAYVTTARGISAARMRTLMQAVVPPKSVYQDFFGLRVVTDTTTNVNPITRSIQYAFGPSVSADATASLQNDGSVISINPGVRGNDYVKPPLVAMSPQVMNPAQLRAFLRVSGFVLDAGGAGYATAPTVTLIGGLPPADKNFVGCVRRIYVKEPGLGYDPANTVVSIQGGGPAGPGAPTTRQATATPVFDAFGRITAVNLTDMGSGYTRIPNIAFMVRSGVPPRKIAKAFAVMANGTPALAHATLAGPAVNAVVLDSPGRGYVNVPDVVLTGGGGTGAAAHARLELDRVDVLFRGAAYPQVGTTVVFTTYFKNLFPNGPAQAGPFSHLFKSLFNVGARAPIIATAPVLA